MICKICGTNETDNPDGICDNCKFSIVNNDDIPPAFYKNINSIDESFIGIQENLSICQSRYLLVKQLNK